MRKTLPLLLLLALASCGYTPGQRAVSGGAMGAALGAGIMGLAGGPMAAGALIGAGAGALGGVVTTPHR